MDAARERLLEIIQEGNNIYCEHLVFPGRVAYLEEIEGVVVGVENSEVGLIKFSGDGWEVTVRPNDTVEIIEECVLVCRQISEDERWMCIIALSQKRTGAIRILYSAGINYEGEILGTS